MRVPLNRHSGATRRKFGVDVEPEMRGHHHPLLKAGSISQMPAWPSSETRRAQWARATRLQSLRVHAGKRHHHRGGASKIVCQPLKSSTDHTTSNKSGQCAPHKSLRLIACLRGAVRSDLGGSVEQLRVNAVTLDQTVKPIPPLRPHLSHSMLSTSSLPIGSRE